MAKTALDQQGRRASRSSRCAATRAASGAAVRTRCTASSACAGSACARWRTAASCPASPRAAGTPQRRQVPRNGCGNLVRKGRQPHDDDRPDRRHADASAQRELGVPRHRVACRTPSSRRTSPRSSRARATSPAGGRGRRRGQDAHASSSSTARTASVRSPASSACRKPGLRVYAKSTKLPKVLGGLGVAILSTSSGLLTDRQADQEGRGWGSPRLRLVSGKEHHVPHRTTAHRHPRRRRRRRSTAQDVTVKGPKGALDATPSPRPSRSSATTTAGRRHPPRRRARLALAARPDPHAHRQHGHRRHRGLREEASRSSAPVTACTARARTSSSRSASATPSPSTPPAGITFTVEGTTKLSVQGIDKQEVGEVAANIRKIRKPEPYKGKGVRYAGESRPPQGRKGW